MSAARMKRVNALVKRELSQLIRKRLPVENHGLISVTDVDVSKDLKIAHVYISAVRVGHQQIETVIASLERVRGGLQRELSHRVILKYTPHLVFKCDHGIERAQHVLEILDDLERK